MATNGSGEYTAITYAEPGTTKTKLVRIAIPEPGLGEVLVRLRYSGVCHTDYGFCMGVFDGIPLLGPGVGEVVAHGIGVQFPPIGSNVGIKYTADCCLSCKNCLEGAETSCDQAKISGFTTPGTFQQYVVSPARYVTPIPDGIDLAAAAPLMCGGVSVYAALKRSGLRNGDWVVVSGAGGGLGHLGIQYAKALGGRVLAIDRASKEEFCRELGAEEFLDFAQFTKPEELASSIKATCGGVGAKVVLMCSSNVEVYSQSLGWLQTRGTLICLGIPEDQASFAAHVVAMVASELTIIATKSGNRLEAAECLEIAARCGIQVKYQLRKMEELTEIFEEMTEGKILGRIVLDLR
ncbi:alcohol dehydrogenase [Xylariales sp. PMI_506]|nr:alcohol dehydrogenase [Xylariales sp. PMI_506]